MKTWMLRKTNSSFLAQDIRTKFNSFHGPNSLHCWTSHVSISWLIIISHMIHTYNSHGVFAKEEEERKGTEGSRGEWRGEGQAQEHMCHSAPGPSIEPMLLCVFCSFHSRCSVLKNMRFLVQLGRSRNGETYLETKSPTGKCGYRRPKCTTPMVLFL